MRTRPIAAIILGLALVATGCDTGPDQADESIQAGPSPTLAALETMEPEARAVAERVVAFVGGAEAIDGVRTMEVRFEGQSDGNPIEFHLRWSRSGPAFYDMVLGPDSGQFGVNGERYWRSMEGEPAELYVMDPELEYGWNEMAGQVLEFTSLPLAVINPTNSHDDGAAPLERMHDLAFKGQQTAVLSFTAEPDPDDPMHRSHYDAQTGRPVGLTQGLPTEPLYMAFSDWREVEGGNGLKMFHRVRVDGFWLGDEVFDLKATLVRVNTLDEADFDPPADAVLQTDG
ncbi:MAG: hypothetical protein RIE32_04275 [Phycisphaerales bacterium]